MRDEAVFQPDNLNRRIRIFFHAGTCNFRTETADHFAFFHGDKLCPPRKQRAQAIHIHRFKRAAIDHADGQSAFDQQLGSLNGV